MTNKPPESFESAYARLEKILELKDRGNAALEDSMKLYQEADELINYCNKSLKTAEKKIETLIKNRSGEVEMKADGNPQTTLFEPTQTGI